MAGLLVLLSACGGGEAAAPAVPTAAGAPDEGIGGVRAPSDATGGTLRVSIATIDHLDPQRSYTPAVWNLMRLYTRTLVTYDTTPGRTDQLVPDLATDTGTPSNNGLTWTFTLKEGVRFETGRPITSRDIEYGIARTFDANVIVGGPTHAIDLFDDPADPYAGPYADDGDVDGLASIVTPDDRTIVFTLARPAPDLGHVLALPSSSPVPVENDTRGGYDVDPVSSGPYAVTSVDPVTGVVLDRNPQWDPATDDVRTALPDRVVVKVGQSSTERDQALLAGAADVDATGLGVHRATTSRLESDPGLGDRVDDVASGSVRMLALASTVAPLDNPSCRAAVAAAVDRRAVQEALGGSSAADRTSQLWTERLPDGPEDPDPAPDTAAAREALATCGYPEGFATVLAVQDVTELVEVAEVIAAQLGEIGIQVRVQPMPGLGFYGGDGIGRPDNVTAQGFGLMLISRRADFPSPGSLLVPLVDGRSVKPEGNTNYARLADPGIDQLVDTALAAPDPAQANATWVQVAQAAVATGAYVPLAEDRLQLLAGQRLRNGVVMAPYRSYDLATAGVG
ncbi:ABC transporter substrate-binding protein [Modestobacter sp. I12A-02628]|uniref:ABC transporter substrate-binding protein n=1 Tax=Goekera deserti TaxID=2497753 RepID=A0A7K3WD66_9ACTN|nr:ABC transporter substrate-binding protein [Goekera deserti]NDI46863.1 ABC transporter substrate-binding protein [Goekera deserti]NEL54431.1 ABC transporter substrate-binding protein [Goekera deserti]